MSNLKEKLENKESTNIHNIKNIPIISKEFFIKRKKMKLTNNNINRRTLFVNKKKLLIDEPEENKDNEPLIKSNNFISNKKEFLNFSSKILKRNNINKTIFNYELNDETCNKFLNNKKILDFNPNTERKGELEIKLGEGFMRKVDYYMNNLLLNKSKSKSKSKRSKTAKINNNRVDKSINVMDYHINQFIKSQNSFQKKNENYNYYNNFEANNNFKSISNAITDINEEEIIHKKKIKNKEEKREKRLDILNDIEHKVLFIDNKNNLISKNNIINLLNEEEYLIHDKIKKDFCIKNFSKFIKYKDGKKIILPILFKKIINRNKEKNFLFKEKNSPFMTSIKKENNNINQIYYILEKKPKSSKTYIDRDINDTSVNNIDNNNYSDNNNNNDTNNINNISNKNKQLHNTLHDINYDNLFITDYSNKRSLKLNQDKFNQFILIDKMKKRNKNDSSKKKNSKNYNKIYLIFNSKYPLTETIGLDQLDNSLYENKETKPTTGRQNENSFKTLFKNKFKKKFSKSSNIINDFKSKTIQNKQKNKIDILKTNEINAQVNKKGVNEDKKERKINHYVRKNNEESKSKEKKIIKIQNQRNSNLKINKNKKSIKLKNFDLLKIKESYLPHTKEKDDYIDENITNNPNKDIELNNINDINNIKKYNINNISLDNIKDKEIPEENKKSKNPKKLGLLVGNIENILNNEKKKEEMKNKYLKEKSLKESYDLFQEQLEIANNIKISRIKRLFSEMHNSNKRGHQEKNKFFRLDKSKNKNENSLTENNDLNSIKDEEEEKNKMLEKKEKNKLLVEEMNLINEIKFYMSTMDDPESYKKFENLLKQIDAFRKLNDKDYIKQIKENFGNFKDEIEDIFRSREIEERINGFVTDLDKEINKSEMKRSFYESLINIVDHKFKSSIGN